MVSDSELVERLREVLRESDLTTTTTGALRRRLEEDFGVDLSDKKTFFREQVDLLLSEFADKAEREDADGAAPAEGEEDPEEVIAEAEGEEGSGGEGAEEGEEEEEEDGSSNGNRKKKRRLGDGKKKAGGFTKLCSISPALQEFVGASELARTEVVKKIWAYIKEHNLQDPSNRRKILCDEALKKIFNVNSIDMFQMNKALTKHIWPLNSEGPVSPKRSEPKEPKEKPQKRDRNEGNKKKGGSSGSGSASGLLAPVQLSEDLTRFIGTGESMLSRSDVVKRMWDYIKANNLQDPSDRRKIICDEKLKDLFQVESFTGFTVSKLLNPHFTKAT
ncbi:hypothetical protein ACQ4PT_046696 [Festuca glaucescens]